MPQYFSHPMYKQYKLKEIMRPIDVYMVKERDTLALKKDWRDSSVVNKYMNQGKLFIIITFVSKDNTTGRRWIKNILSLKCEI